jgi:hypothetical protein
VSVGRRTPLSLVSDHGRRGNGRSGRGPGKSRLSATTAWGDDDGAAWGDGRAGGGVTAGVVAAQWPGRRRRGGLENGGVAGEVEGPADWSCRARSSPGTGARSHRGPLKSWGIGRR